MMPAGWFVWAWLGAIAVATWSTGGNAPPQDAAPARQDAPLVRGAKVTFHKPSGDGPSVSVRSRLLAIAVERGETPTPVLGPGMFAAKYSAVVTLPVRDRYGFSAEGRGSIELRVNGEKVLGGTLRSGKPLATDAPIRLKKGENLLEVDFESGALGDGSFRLLWSGPDFRLEPIAPERLQSRADDVEILAGERLRLGHQLFVERRCAMCHGFRDDKRVGETAFGEHDQPGPDLRQVGGRATKAWIAAWLRDPHRMRKNATMPRVPLTEHEVLDVAEYLAGLGAPLAVPPFTAEQAQHGQARFLELGCVACHVVAGHGDAALGDRIDLSAAPQKWHASGLVAYLQEPRRHHASVRMPDFRLSQDDAAALAAHLLAQQAEPLADAKGGDATRGQVAMVRHACNACHVFQELDPELSLPKLRNLDADEGCLADDASKAKAAPDHNLSAEQRAALRAFLPFAEDAPFRRAPLDYVARQRQAQRCTACHGLDGEPSTWARWATATSAQQPLPKEQDPNAEGLPALTWVGEKLQPSWMERFVTGAEKSPRPWLKMRMPAFHRRGAPIVQGMVREHGYAQDERKEPPNAQLVIFGERLLQMGTGFGCVQCHALGDKPAVQVFERAGIELFTARQRLRHDYYTRWLADPPRIDPDSRMPKYADDKGKTAFTDVLGGDAAQQFEAMWQFLSSRVR